MSANDQQTDDDTWTGPKLIAIGAVVLVSFLAFIYVVSP